jgi:peptidoglycan/xylan/chitin deacetylase (PgdA/CDA1 family)
MTMNLQNRHVSRSLAALSAAVTVAAAGVAFGSPASAATATVRSTIDDTVSRGASHFSYTGTWWNCSRCRSDSYGGSFHYTNRRGAAVRLTFTGTGAVLYGVRQPAGGIATVTLDGKVRGTVNLAASRTGIAAIYTTPTLRQGVHTLTLTVSSRTTGRGHTVSIDRAVVSTTAPAPTPPAPRPPTPKPPVTPTPPAQPAPSAGTGMASFTFDDGQLGQFQNAEPLLRAAGFHGTFYVISDGMGWGAPQMSAAQVRQLASAGEEIGSHTRDHAHLGSLTAAQVDAEFADAQAAFRSQVGLAPTTCAYPYGDATSTVEQIAAKYFKACRGTGSGTNAAGADAYNLRVFYVQSSTTAAQVRAAADAARAAGSWVIFVYHGVGTGGTADDVTTAQFGSEVDAVKASGISVRTVSQAMAARS